MLLVSGQRVVLNPRCYVDFDRQDIVKDQIHLALSRQQYRLIFRLAKDLGHPVSREELMKYVWETWESGCYNVLYVCVHRIRDIIEEDASRPKHLLPIKGMGYMLCAI